MQLPDYRSAVQPTSLAITNVDLRLHLVDLFGSAALNRLDPSISNRI